MHVLHSGFKCERMVGAELGLDMSFVIGVIVIQFVIHPAFYPDAPGVSSMMAYHFKPGSAYILALRLPVLVDGLLLSITLTVYALQSPVMQWDLGITMDFTL